MAGIETTSELISELKLFLEMYCRPRSTLYSGLQATVMNSEQAESLDYCMYLQLHSPNSFLYGTEYIIPRYW